MAATLQSTQPRTTGGGPERPRTAIAKRNPGSRVPIGDFFGLGKVGEPVATSSKGAPQMSLPTPDRAHLLTVEEAAECLGIGRTKTYELMMGGDLASIKIGSRRLIPVSSVAAYIQDQLGHIERPVPLTRDTVEALVESGEVRSITLGKYLFVSVDSLDAYVHGQQVIAS